MKWDPNEEMSKILGIYNCDKFIELIKDMFEICYLYNVDPSDDWVKDVVGDEVISVRQARTAFLLSKLAYNHANTLKQVNRAAPGFWQRAEKFTQSKEIIDFKVGKSLD
jgi:hypothetical protein